MTKREEIEEGVAEWLLERKAEEDRLYDMQAIVDAATGCPCDDCLHVICGNIDNLIGKVRTMRRMGWVVEADLLDIELDEQYDKQSLALNEREQLAGVDEYGFPVEKRR